MLVSAPVKLDTQLWSKPQWMEVQVDKPMYIFHPCHSLFRSPCDSLFSSLLGSDRVAEETGWQVSTEWVVLYSWFFISPVEVTLWQAFTQNINLFTFLAHSEKSVYMFLSQISLPPIFPSSILNQGMSSFLVHSLCLHFSQPNARAFSNSLSCSTKCRVFV